MKRYLHARIPILLVTGILILGVGLVVSLLFEPMTSPPVASPENLGVEPKAAAVRDEHEQEFAKIFKQGVMMLHAERYDYAVVALHRVLQLAPRMPEAHANMGFALLGQGNHQAAQDFFESALAIRPAQVNAYYGLAMTLEHACDLPGAIGAMRTYLHLVQDSDPFKRKARSALWEWEATVREASDADHASNPTSCLKARLDLDDYAETDDQKG